MDPFHLNVIILNPENDKNKQNIIENKGLKEAITFNQYNII